MQQEWLRYCCLNFEDKFLPMLYPKCVFLPPLSADKTSELSASKTKPSAKPKMIPAATHFSNIVVETNLERLISDRSPKHSTPYQRSHSCFGLVETLISVGSVWPDDLSLDKNDFFVSVRVFPTPFFLPVPYLCSLSYIQVFPSIFNSS